MNSPNAAQLIHYVLKGQAVNNVLMARDEPAEKRRKTFPFDLPAVQAVKPSQNTLGIFCFLKSILACRAVARWPLSNQPVFALARYDAAALAFRRVAREI
jgi:hypothetical protein